MPNRYNPTKSTATLLCEHPNTPENTLSLNARDGTLLVKCMTCKAEQEYVPARWRKRIKMGPRKDSEEETETVSAESKSETVTVVS